jgi:hypothetical protein
MKPGKMISKAQQRAVFVATKLILKKENKEDSYATYS